MDLLPGLGVYVVQRRLAAEEGEHELTDDHALRLTLARLKRHLPHEFTEFRRDAVKAIRQERGQAVERPGRIGADLRFSVQMQTSLSISS
jgi:hypothetical protein